jgi:putative membrane protein
MKVRNALAALWIAYAVFWVGGVGGHLLYGGTPANMGWTAPLFLALASLLVVFSNLADWRACALSFAAGFAAEAVGVATGFPFGAYSYTGALAPSLFGVPLVVAGAWMILIAWVRQLSIPIWGGAIAMTLFDLVIDPLAANTLGYWKWSHAGPYFGVPLSNFAGWFCVSLLILAILRTTPPRRLGIVLTGCSILIFFALVGLAHHYLAPALIGVVMVAWGLARARIPSDYRQSNTLTEI